MFPLPKHIPLASRVKSNLFLLLSLHTASPAKTNQNPEFKFPTHPNLDSLLAKCTSIKELKQIHAHIIQIGYQKEILTAGKLIAFCATSQMGDLCHAQLVFDQIAEPNRFMWNSLIRGYSNSSNPRESIFLYSRMMGAGFTPNEFTFPFVFKACSLESAFMEAFGIHVHVVKLGFGSQVFVQNALFHVYAVCGLIQSARQLFDDLSERSLVSWNSMIGGYSRVGCCKEAFSLFRTMMDSGMEPDNFTLVNLLSVCSETGNSDMGRFLHLYIEINGVETDLFVKNALVDMYAKCGDLVSAQTLFDRMPEKNVVSWTSMVGAYAQHGFLDLARCEFDKMSEKNVVSWNAMISFYLQKGLFQKVLDLFTKMEALAGQPNEATLVSVLTACSQLGDLMTGKKTHVYIRNNNIQPSVTLCNSLIDMYAKCGPVDVALHLFRQMSVRNVVSWNVMIGALAMHGRALNAIDLFTRMQNDGVPPDGITFVGVLCACSHGGFLDTGQHYFDTMSLVHGVPREIEHYACMVDLLGRGGRLQEAVELIGDMPMKPDVVVWGALLGACRIHGNMEIGKQVLKQLLELEPLDGGGLYVLISNMFCEANRWEDVKRVRKLMKDKGIRKGRALSLIEIDGDVHEFVVEDKRHGISSQIYLMLDQLTDHMRCMGYLFNTSRAFFNVEERGQLYIPL